MDGDVRGLNSFDDHPPVAPVFWGFRVMVGVGLLMLRPRGGGRVAAAARRRAAALAGALLAP
jgi:cytochrome bd-type quinol oxidase subunit 1